MLLLVFERGDTAGNFMYFMLYEKVNEWDETCKETARDVFTVFQGLWVERGHGDHAQCPWESTE
jgi:hypothetical protein